MQRITPGVILGYQGWPSIITRVLISGKQEHSSGKRQCHNWSRGWSDAVLTLRQGTQAVSRSWKSQRTESPWDPPGASSAKAFTLAQWDPQGTSDFQNSKIVNVCCYSSNRKTDTDTPVASRHWPCHSVLFSSSRRRSKHWLTNFGVRPWKGLTHSFFLFYFLKILFTYFDVDH